MIVCYRRIRFPCILNTLLVKEDRIARTFFEFWKPQIVDRSDKSKEVAVRTMCHGLAFLIQHLIIAYSEEKTKLGKLFEDVSPELTTDYDLLRETGINPRHSESFLKLAPEDKFRLAMKGLDQARSWSQSDGAIRGEEPGSVALIDPNYATSSEVFLDMRKLFRPLSDLDGPSTFTDQRNNNTPHYTRV